MAVHSDGSGTFSPVSCESGALASGSCEPVRVLFVDDDPILREFAVVNLSSELASVATAGDGAEALAAIEAALPDMVLLDLEMPGVDGFETLRRLRGDPRRRDLPVIVVAGREDVEAVDRAFDLGATSFVVKPLNWRLLSHQLRYVRRMASSERTMDARRVETAEQLVKLAAVGTQFITRALSRDPSLKDAAVAFAKAADAALTPSQPARAA